MPRVATLSRIVECVPDLCSHPQNFTTLTHYLSLSHASADKMLHLIAVVAAITAEISCPFQDPPGVPTFVAGPFPSPGWSADVQGSFNYTLGFTTSSESDTIMHFIVDTIHQRMRINVITQTGGDFPRKYQQSTFITSIKSPSSSATVLNITTTGGWHSTTDVHDFVDHLPCSYGWQLAENPFPQSAIDLGWMNSVEFGWNRKVLFPFNDIEQYYPLTFPACQDNCHSGQCCCGQGTAASSQTLETQYHSGGNNFDAFIDFEFFNREVNKTLGGLPIRIETSAWDKTLGSEGHSLLLFSNHQVGAVNESDFPATIPRCDE